VQCNRSTPLPSFSLCHAPYHAPCNYWIPLQGFNASIIAYGQTGTGKTYTMEGERAGPGAGIIPRAIEDVFAHIQHGSEGESCKFLVRASYLQIYNEVRVPASLPASLPACLCYAPRIRGEACSAVLVTGCKHVLERC
jgi:hypothetical protein